MRHTAILIGALLIAGIASAYEVGEDRTDELWLSTGLDARVKDVAKGKCHLLIASNYQMYQMHRPLETTRKYLDECIFQETMVLKRNYHHCVLSTGRRIEAAERPLDKIRSDRTGFSMARGNGIYTVHEDFTIAISYCVDDAIRKHIAKEDYTHYDPKIFGLFGTDDYHKE